MDSFCGRSDAAALVVQCQFSGFSGLGADRALLYLSALCASNPLYPLKLYTHYSFGRSRSLSRTVLRVPNLIVFCPSLESWPPCSRLLISCCIVWARSSSPWLSSRVTALLS